MKAMIRFTTACAVLLLIVPAASADWSDNFDSYASGSGLIGQGGWDGWEGSAAADGFVTDVFAYSSPNSLGSIPTTDLVQEFSETSGNWIMTGYMYIPTGSTGMQYFIMLNIYDGGTSTFDWSIQVEFDADAGTVTDTMSEQFTTMIYDSWTQIRVEIHLETCLYELYYNDVQLSTWVWQETGVNEIAALDIFSDGGSTIYWDDLSLVEGGSALEQTTWGHIKAVMQ